ncbi:hypothetical protein BABINDRAFT_160860 [Babjeviella inositovora NRRL Y-12698]|uniref:Uncharacterized protein n=1 Tax=Babjeviella inositovora NRRL Y-12698 TaxID=984486 RepID=A0A1E3QSX2_9ASCO|nr:uncharacterized protein BABINDRAFT_160860 [Babjeviella inositovora NRRL Y-12698]ODQ80604.1 hypothetical protein BABINDRAFT_160860 [Babjeviella inositovora NRRL Y-12698]
MSTTDWKEIYLARLQTATDRQCVGSAVYQACKYVGLSLRSVLTGQARSLVAAKYPANRSIAT